MKTFFVTGMMVLSLQTAFAARCDLDGIERDAYGLSSAELKKEIRVLKEDIEEMESELNWTLNSSKRRAIEGNISCHRTAIKFYTYLIKNPDHEIAHPSDW